MYCNQGRPNSTQNSVYLQVFTVSNFIATTLMLNAQTILTLRVRRHTICWQSPFALALLCCTHLVSFNGLLKAFDSADHSCAVVST